MHQERDEDGGEIRINMAKVAKRYHIKGHQEYYRQITVDQIEGVICQGGLQGLEWLTFEVLKSMSGDPAAIQRTSLGMCSQSTSTLDQASIC